MDIMEYVVIGVVLYVGFRALWISEQMLEQRRKNYRAGTHDYYGNKL